MQQSELIQKQMFQEKLHETQNRLVSEGIDYRIIGSLASHAYLEGKILPLDFNRAGAATADQRVPDIDIIAPRIHLPAIRAIRTELQEASFPVKLGVAVPTTEIDFLPDEEYSYLTHKNLALPVSNELFRPTIVDSDGTNIRTVPVDTLTHTYGAFGGKIRHKDINTIKALLAEKSEFDHADMDVFHDFQLQRRRLSPGEYRLGRTIEWAESKVPRRVRNEFFRVALKAADLLGKR